MAIALLSAIVFVVWRRLDPDDKINWADLAAVAIAASVAIATVVTWARRPRLSAGPLSQADAAAAADTLAELVRQQWQAEARHRSLDDPEPIAVSWQFSSNETVMSHPRLITAQTDFTFTGHSGDIAALARDFQNLTHRRLVITGGPGMGKTTLAIQLLLHLLATRTGHQLADGSEIVPVPVLLPVSGWNPHAHPRLQQWLADRLVQDYPALKAPQLGPDVATALVTRGYILPILDGLDEIGEQARATVITALNASLATGDQLILTSRTTEFATAVTTAGRPLNAAAVITPVQLSPQTSAAYLRACLPAIPSNAWRNVLTAIETRALAGLTEMTATPYGLWLIRAVYADSGTDPTPLTGPLGNTTTTLRVHLLDELIPSLIKTRPPSTESGDHFLPRHQLDPATTRRYLTYLARCFPPATTRDIAWWRIAGTTPNANQLVKRTFGLAGGVIGGLVGGLLAFPMIIVLEGPLGSFDAPLSGLLLGGLVTAILSWLSTNAWPSNIPGHADLRRRGRVFLLLRAVSLKLPFGLLVGFVFGFLVGLGTMFPITLLLAIRVAEEGDELFVLRFALEIALSGGVSAGFRVGLPCGIVLGLARGLMIWAEQPAPTSFSTPTSSWRSDRTLTLLRTLLFGLAGGLPGSIVIGLAIWDFVESDFWFWLLLWGTFGLTFGLLGGLAGLISGSHHAWLACTIVTGRLALTRQLPWRIMNFLDDAHRLGLLRAVGPIYQFRHATLHDHLATSSPTGPATEPAALQPDAQAQSGSPPPVRDPIRPAIEEHRKTTQS
ncbi:NACHT domain-containing protein [Streptosporangium sp. NPDC049046]|uniref:NACHT domain-containing protein n=1 Tax=Streptosporangium sp. NPDC049046 TaxID=3155031 RepID=UPI00343759F5